jgi:hypothetical protein
MAQFPSNVNLCAGTYTVSVTDGNGCYSSSSATIGSGTCSPAFSVVPDNFTPHMYWIADNVTGTTPISYLWTWGDATSDTIPFPSHTYAQEGFYDICLSMSDAAGCSCMNCWSAQLARMDATNTMISVTVVPQIPTSALDYPGLDLNLFPNPACSELRIKNEELRIENIEVYSSLGELIFNQQPTAGSQQQITIDASQWNNGIYFVKVKTPDGDKTQKLVVQH